MKLEKPELNDFFIRRIPIDVALEAREKWETLTDKEKEKLGFTPHDDSAPSPLKIFLSQQDEGEVFH